MTTQSNIGENWDVQAREILDMLDADGGFPFDSRVYEISEGETMPYLIEVPLDRPSPAYDLIEFDDHWICTEISRLEEVSANENNVRPACERELESTPVGHNTREPARLKRVRHTRTGTTATGAESKRGSVHLLLVQPKP